MSIILFQLLERHILHITQRKSYWIVKLNRIVQYFFKTSSGTGEINGSNCQFPKKELDTNDVACVIDAKHLCVSMRA